MAALPDPSVPPSVYDEAYYREWCAGYEEWVASEGRATSGIYPGFLLHAGLGAGEVVVDMGTGRGELLAVAVEMGAAHAYGIEYSADAVGMAQQTLAAHGVGDKAEVLQADARSVPLPDRCADLVCYVDVVEHLTPDELHVSLVEAKRLLRPSGRVVAHTMPNRLVYEVTYLWLRRLGKWLPGVGGRKWPENPRHEHELTMHVNEQTLRSLRDAFEAAGLVADVELGVWVYDDFVPAKWARNVYKGLSKVRPLAQYGIGDLWATGRLSAADQRLRAQAQV